MNNKFVIMTLLVGIPGAAIGQGSMSYQCTFGDLQRRVEILTEPGVSVPCEVHYHKDTETPGERQVLWSATQEAGYCERKTEEFVAKLESWGWTCATSAGETEPAAAPDPATAPEPAGPPEPSEIDDTDALAPVEEAAQEQE